MDETDGNDFYKERIIVMGGQYLLYIIILTSLVRQAMPAYIKIARIGNMQLFRIIEGCECLCNLFLYGWQDYRKKNIYGKHEKQERLKE
ncbi:MAG: hypothetical protein HS132_13645 [Planctomycetia bacterium]|nr:hypothetical protein [Planctomycetia bacterium]